jgi:peptidoglycan/LPS O-acetylase OafA/YrhL
MQNGPILFLGFRPNPDFALNPSRPRLYSLDALRGLAALGVVLWHWQHFFGPAFGIPYRPADMPFYAVLFPFYRFGWLAVFLFFSLSGFIFFRLYAHAIRDRTVSVAAFAALRFSRLVPLHLATLLGVALGQAAFRHLHGFDFVYVHNDLYHFTLNLFMVSFWGFEKGYSFNGPFWSVSVEVLLYALFFAFCRRVSAKTSVLFVTGVTGYILLTPLVEMVGKGFGAFFLGGAAYTILEKLRKAGMSRPGWLRGAAFCIPLATLLFAAAGFWIRLRFPHFVWPHTGSPGWRLSEQFVGFVALVLSPLVVLSVALLESVFEPTCRASARRLAWLGDLSYSSYLLHFPLQLTFVCLTTALAVPTTFYASPPALLLFFGILIPLSLAVHHGFERPLQRWLRVRLVPVEKG